MGDPDLWEQLRQAVEDNLRPWDSRVLPILVSSAAIPDLDLPDWDELTRIHPHVRETGLLVIPEQLWPDPATPTYDMGAFLAVGQPTQPAEPGEPAPK